MRLTLVDRIVWIYFIFHLIVLLVQLLNAYQDSHTLKINTGMGLFLMAFALAAKKMRLNVKIGLLSVIAIY